MLYIKKKDVFSSIPNPFCVTAFPAPPRTSGYTPLFACVFRIVVMSCEVIFSHSVLPHPSKECFFFFNHYCRFSHFEIVYVSWEQKYSSITQLNNWIRAKEGVFIWSRSCPILGNLLGQHFFYSMYLQPSVTHILRERI